MPRIALFSVRNVSAFLGFFFRFYDNNMYPHGNRLVVDLEKTNFRMVLSDRRIRDFLHETILSFQAKLGVGRGSGPEEDRGPTHVSAVDSDRVCAVGRMFLSMLEQQAMEKARHRLTANEQDLDFSGGHLSPAVSAVDFLAKRPVTSVEFARITSLAESLVAVHRVRFIL